MTAVDESVHSSYISRRGRPSGGETWHYWIPRH